MRLHSLAIPVLVFTLGATAASAQNAPSPEICGAEASEYMQELDGVWSVKQGAGRAVGTATVPFRSMDASIRGMVPTMLPAQDPVDLKLEHVPSFGFSILSGQGQSMLMVPADRERAVEELQYQREQSGDGTAGEGANCASGALPVLVGTNDYVLISSPVRLPPSSILPGAPCSLDVFVAHFVSNTGAGSPPSTQWRTQDCDEIVEEPLPRGAMRMRIVVEFDSSTSGSGYFYFDGEAQGIEFAAIADVTLSRSGVARGHALGGFDSGAPDPNPRNGPRDRIPPGT